jgi:hypothetical protein
MRNMSGKDYLKEGTMVTETARIFGTSGAYRMVDVGALIDDESELAPMVEGILYPGLMTLIGSWVGTGKTTLAMGIIAALLKQEPAFEVLDIGPLHGPVVYFSELPRQALARTLRRTILTEELDQADFARRVRFLDIHGGSILDPMALRDFGEATRGAALVIIDTFDAWLGDNPNKTHQTLKAWAALKDVATQGAAILVLSR